MHPRADGLTGVAVLQMMKPFIDPVTKDKIRCASGTAGLEEQVDLDQVEACMGGRSQWQFQPSVYGSQMECAPEHASAGP